MIDYNSHPILDPYVKYSNKKSNNHYTRPEMVLYEGWTIQNQQVGFPIAEGLAWEMVGKSVLVIPRCWVTWPFRLMRGRTLVNDVCYCQQRVKIMLQKRITDYKCLLILDE